MDRVGAARDAVPGLSDLLLAKPASGCDGGVLRATPVATFRHSRRLLAGSSWLQASSNIAGVWPQAEVFAARTKAQGIFMVNSCERPRAATSS